MATILFVCLGNICRSPAAEGVLLHLATKRSPAIQVHAESCGLGDWHQGQLPDPRMREAAQDRGIVLTSRAKAFDQEFFDRFDYILAADLSVLQQLQRWAKKPEHIAKIHLITRFSSAFKDAEIPDPFYLERAHFDLVLDMLEEACQGILDHIAKESDRT